MSRRLPDAAHGLLWISPWVLGTLLFLVVPVGLSVYFSFTEYSLLEPPVYVGADNYRELAHDALFWKALKNTLVYAGACTLLGTVLSVGVAALLESRLRGADLVRAVVFLPTLIPVVSASIGWLWLYNGQYGLFNTLLGMAGLRGPDWLGDPRWAMPSLVIMSLWSVGSAVVVCGAAMRGVPASLYEAADLDGMGRWARFRHVTLPVISPAVLFNAVMGAIYGLQVFAVPLIMTKGGPDNATLVYSMYVFRSAFEYGRMGYASALAWVQFFITLGLTAAALLAARRLVHYREA